MSDPTPQEVMQQRYHNVFSSPEGKLVLGDILTKGHYGITLDPDNPVMIGEYNFALIIATIAGVFNPLYAQLGLGQEKEK